LPALDALLRRTLGRLRGTRGRPCPQPSTPDWPPPTTGLNSSSASAGQSRPATSWSARSSCSASTVARRADRFDAYGIAGFLTSEEPPHSLPLELRQAIVELQAEYAALRPYEIAAICYVRFGRRPSPHTVARIVAEDPLPLPLTRRFPPYHEISDPVQRRLAIIRLHAEGWRVSCIAG
jgi:hypothetical protein